MRRMGPKRRDWERHVQEALDVARPTPEPLPPLPVRHVQCQKCGWWTDDAEAHAEYMCESLPPEAHGSECPCRVCTTYQPHEIIGNWHPSKGPRAGLYLVADETEHERAEDA